MQVKFLLGRKSGKSGLASKEKKKTIEEYRSKISINYKKGFEKCSERSKILDNLFIFNFKSIK